MNKRMKKNKYCIYMHTAPNGKMYIGQTCDINHRFGNNGYNYKGCKRFMNAIKKYGWDNFEHRIISSNLTKEEADFQEMFYISAYNLTDDKYGYNITKGGAGVGLSCEKNGMFGKHHTKESRHKMSIHHPLTIPKRRKPIVQLTLDGKFIKIWDSNKSVAQALHISKGNLCNHCKNGIPKTIGGFTFRYLKEFDTSNDKNNKIE